MQVGARLPARAVRDLDGQLARRHDAPGQHAGERGPALLAGDERLDGGGQPAGVAAERVRPPRHDHEHERRARLQQRLDQLVLDPGQREVLDVAALTRGAAPEQAGAIPDHGDADVGRAGRVGRRRELRPVGLLDRAARLVDDRGVGQLRAQAVEERRHLDAEPEVLVARHDAVVGERVATEEGERVVGAGADERERAGRARAAARRRCRAARPTPRRARARSRGGPAGRGRACPRPWRATRATSRRRAGRAPPSGAAPAGRRDRRAPPAPCRPARRSASGSP